MSDELVFYTHPMSRARHRPVDAGGGRPALRDEDPGIRPFDEGAGLSGDQSDGQGAGDPPRRHGRYRGRRHLRLSGRRFPGSRTRPAARRARARPLLSLAVLRRGTARGRSDRQGARLRDPAGPGGHGRLRQHRANAGRAGRRALPHRVHRGRPLHRRRRLCRVGDRLGHVVREDRPASGLRALLGADQRPSGCDPRARAWTTRSSRSGRRRADPASVGKEGRCDWKERPRS